MTCSYFLQHVASPLDKNSTVLRRPVPPLPQYDAAHAVLPDTELGAA